MRYQTVVTATGPPTPEDLDTPPNASTSNGTTATDDQQDADDTAASSTASFNAASFADNPTTAADADADDSSMEGADIDGDDDDDAGPVIPSSTVIIEQALVWSGDTRMRLKVTLKVRQIPEQAELDIEVRLLAWCEPQLWLVCMTPGDWRSVGLKPAPQCIIIHCSHYHNHHHHLGLFGGKEGVRRAEGCSPKCNRHLKHANLQLANCEATHSKHMPQLQLQAIMTLAHVLLSVHLQRQCCW